MYFKGSLSYTYIAMAAASPQQLNRIHRMWCDPLYLLDYSTPERNKHVWKVSGSTRNVYTISLFPSCRMFCDCPDMKSHAARQRVVCKHILFVLLRVLGFSRDDPLVWQRAYLRSEVRARSRVRV